MKNDIIDIRVNSDRGIGNTVIKQLKVEELKKNINHFISTINTVISDVNDKTSEKISSYELSEISISVEISANGALTILGTGVEVGSSNALTFTFSKKQ